MVEWYIAPYDTKDEPVKGLVRIPAIARYIPLVPNLSGADWGEEEILGNHVLAWVDAPEAFHTIIQQDPDFIWLKNSGGVLDQAETVKVRNALRKLGYGVEDLTGLDVDSLAGKLLTKKSEITKSVNGRSFIVGNEKATKNRLGDLKRRMR